MNIQQQKLKGIADAIREKDGTTQPISADDFAARILAIKTSGSLPTNVRTIAVSAVPTSGGTVSGGGVASDAMTVTVRAEAHKDSNIVFESWKEDGAVVSVSESYSFIVCADRTLVAIFSELQYVAGVDWWEYALPIQSWKSVAYGGGKFVALVGTSSNKAYYSTDGISWTEVTLPAYFDWRAIVYGNGRFVAIAYNRDRAAYSTDGIGWTAATLPTTANWHSIAYANGKFVAVAYGSNKAAYSTDGIKWTAATLPTTANWRFVAYGGFKFVAVAYGSNKAAWSANGISWTAATLPAAANWSSVAYGDGKFVAISSSGKAAYSSAKGPET